MLMAQARWQRRRPEPFISGDRWITIGGWLSLLTNFVASSIDAEEDVGAETWRMECPGWCLNEYLYPRGEREIPTSVPGLA